MIKYFPKVLIPFIISIFIILLIIVIQINFFNLSNETVGYYSLILFLSIIYIFIPLQLILILIKIILGLWKKYKN
jgi:hypothetical protein